MDCETGKISYPTHAAAERKKKLIARRPGGHSTKAYQCRFCDQWHITRSPDSKAVRESRDRLRRARRGED